MGIGVLGVAEIVESLEPKESVELSVVANCGRLWVLESL